VWMEDLAQFFAETNEDGKHIQIWLEDTRSIAEKLDVMEQFDLGGVAAWKLGMEKTGVWEMIEEYMNR